MVVERVPGLLLDVDFRAGMPGHRFDDPLDTVAGSATVGRNVKKCVVL